jgi:hypothetical protein
MKTITHDFSWSPDPYDGQLPPPLCFTVPAGNLNMTGKTLYVGGSHAFGPAQPKLMMDPSDPSTFQRVYRFT